MAIEIIKKPISDIKEYKDKTFFLVSDICIGWADSFINRNDESVSPFGLPENMYAPEGFQAFWYPSLSQFDEFFRKNFDLDPRAHYQIDGFRNSEEIKDLQKITEEGIHRFLELAADKDEKRVILFPDMTTFYCSPNCYNIKYTKF